MKKWMIVIAICGILLFLLTHFGVSMVSVANIASWIVFGISLIYLFKKDYLYAIYLIAMSMSLKITVLTSYIATLVFMTNDQSESISYIYETLLRMAKVLEGMS